MHPGSSVSGLYFSHPNSEYFGVGRIEADQVTVTKSDVERTHHLIWSGEIDVEGHIVLGCVVVNRDVDDGGDDVLSQHGVESILQRVFDACVRIGTPRRVDWAPWGEI